MGNGNNQSGSQQSSISDDESMEKQMNSQDIRFEKFDKILKQINVKLANEDVISKSFLMLKIKSLTTYWDRMSVAHEELGSFGEPLPKAYLDKMSTFEDKYEEILLILQDNLDKLNKASKIENIKMPRVTIPKFEGDYFGWVPFRDLFESIVMANRSLSDSQKMQLLKTSLGGEAEGLIADLTISEVNFVAAWDRLQHRYENNRVIVAQHLKKLVTQAPLKNDSIDSKQLKKLLDTTDQILLALQNLGRPVEHWDDWIILTIAHKLSDHIRREWEKKVGHTTDLPTWKAMKEFLEEEFRISESVENGSKKRGKRGKRATNNAVKTNQVMIEKKINCIICKKQHSLFKCTNFRKMTPEERMNLAKKEKLCFKCLARHEDKLSCDREKPCKNCSRSHNTWLHKGETESKNKVSAAATLQKEEKQLVASTMGVYKNDADKSELTVATVVASKGQALLATAVVAVYNNYGQKMLFRALMDSGSQGSFIRRSAMESLRLDLIDTNDSIIPLGEKARKAPLKVFLNIKPRFQSTFQVEVECYVLQKLTRTLPDENLHIQSWHHLKDLTLADPHFNRVGPIDILLGMDVMAEVLEGGLVKGLQGQPIAQKTALGWIVSGKIDPTYPRKEITSLLALTDREELDLKRFWELEELNPKRQLTPDEKKCEKLFIDSVQRDANGWYTVGIPFKTGQNGPEGLGASKSACIARFTQLEKRLQRDDDLRMEYVRVMNEYISLGHMKLVSNNPMHTKKYYIPHHPVIKPESLTTKVRVVFDASARTTTGLSLNDTMYVGAKQQSDLFDTLIKWRKHSIVFKADIAKMYRQIRIPEEDQQYHTILWRNHPLETLQEFQLTTITFGTAAAPFMAAPFMARAVKYHAEDNETKYPVAAEIIKKDFYVDDLISGSESIKEAITAKDELIAALQDGHFTLRKWSSNSQELLDTLPEELTEKSLQSFSDDDSTKALGLRWNPRTDKFNFAINWQMEDGIITKRKLLSEASRLFDPLGWLAPVVINAKMMMQQIWLAKIEWDDEVPEDIRTKWIQFREELPMLKEVLVDRWINYTENSNIQLIGFCDASEKGYAAAVYTRVQHEDNVEIKLIASKTRVAPVNMKTTIPRLELCGAVLLSNLLTRTAESLQIEGVEKYAWSDSTATLGWLRGDTNRWKTFVANRVSEVKSNAITEWNYVPSEENPADCASRGIMPHELKNHALWWQGPKWLQNHPSMWTRTEILDTDQEQRNIVTNVATINTREELVTASSWFKLVRVIAYCLRMKKGRHHEVNLTLGELNMAKIVLYKRCQQESFPAEVINLLHKKPIPRNSKLMALDPFLDEGRLENALITYDNKHPIILPQSHQVTQLVVRQIHLDTLHGGPQLMVNLLRKQYWILQAKRLANTEYKRCVICRRHKGQARQQIMGQLPRDRVTLERAFLCTGIDYAGPVEIKSSKLRSAKIQKGYIAVFVCMGTKAVHLELVSDLTTDAFLAALNRFMARRGLCSRIYSDNGSNLVGASNKLKKEERQLFLQQNQEMANHVLSRGIEWKFIPPGAPTFRGLWERGVRSMKDHLKKQLKTARLTFEEFNTVLCQIEACLNSRPICPLTDDTENLNALTPGHFLIGDALLAPPLMMTMDNTYNRTHRWKHLQLITQHFWNRWSREYLNKLQQRQKWQGRHENLKKDDMVLIKDEQLPPRCWLMGRIVETHPSPDGLVRVATIRTIKGEFKRPITKICLLVEASEEETPENDDSDESSNEDEDNNPDKDQAKDIEKKSNDIISRKNINKNFVSGTNPDELIERDNSEASSSEEEKEENPKPPPEKVSEKRILRPRSRHGLALMIAALGMILLLGGGATAAPISNTQNGPFQISTITHQSGIYFEDLGTVNLVRTDWHMYIRFNLKTYTYEFETLQKLIENIRDTCDTMIKQKIHTHCGNIVTALEDNMAQIEKWNTVLNSNGHTEINSGPKRKERAAPLNIVGWAGHELFGVMAQDQADHIENNMKLVEENEDHLLNLIKNQSSLVDQTLNLMQITEKEINENYGKLHLILDGMEKENDALKKQVRLMSLSFYTSLLVNRFEKRQQNLLDMVTDVHQGHINSYVLTPQQFQEQLSLINNNLPIGNKLPGNSLQDIKTLYRIISGKTRVTNENIILDVVIPLVSAIDYQLLHIIPYPIEYKENHLTIIPESKYLLITLKRDKFYQMAETDLHDCIQPDAEWFICKTKKPMYNIQSEKSSCERELLAQGANLELKCNFNLTTERDFWIPLKKKNLWVFGLKQPLTINTVCHEKPSSTIVQQGTGVIEVTPGCEIVFPKMSLIAETNKASEGNANFYPPLNLSESIMKEGVAKRLTIVNFTIDHHHQVSEIHQSIKELNEKSTRTHHISNANISVTLILVVILTLGGIVLWCWKNKSHKWYTSTGLRSGRFTRNNGERNVSQKSKDGDQQSEVHLSDHQSKLQLKTSVANHSSDEKSENEFMPSKPIPIPRSSTVARHEGENVRSRSKILSSRY